MIIYYFTMFLYLLYVILNYFHTTPQKVIHLNVVIHFLVYAKCYINWIMVQIIIVPPHNLTHILFCAYYFKNTNDSTVSNNHKQFFFRMAKFDRQDWTFFLFKDRKRGKSPYAPPSRKPKRTPKATDISEENNVTLGNNDSYCVIVSRIPWPEK